jgi:hypothetical protein
MATKTCRVSFRDLDGIRHSAEVQSDTPYEAAVLGLKAFKKSEWIETVGAGTRIDIEVIQPPVAHFLMYAQLMRWLDGGGVNPAEILRKKKQKKLLAS